MRHLLKVGLSGVTVGETTNDLKVNNAAAWVSTEAITPVRQWQRSGCRT